MDQEIELRHLRYFVTVAEEMHFGRAALRLNLAQPPLSQQIRRLEEILGYPLFTRTSRAVKLTAAGEVFLDRAKRTLRTVQEDMDEARSIGRGESGYFRAGFISSAMLTTLPALLGDYHRQYPKVHLQLRESVTAEILKELAAGSLDAGLLRDPDPIGGIYLEPIFHEPYIAVVSAKHPLAKRTAISPHDLRDEPFVLFPQTAGRRAYGKTISLCERHGFRPDIVQEAPQWLTVLRLIGVGFGVTLAPACVREVATSEVVCLPLHDAPVKSEISLAWRTGEDRAIVHSFAAIARKSLATGTPSHVSKARRGAPELLG